MRLRRHRCRWLLAVLLLLCGGVPLQAAPLSVAAASSLRPWLDAVLAQHEATHRGTPARVVYGSTGKHVAQISHGAPFDLFIAADLDAPQRLVGSGLARGPVTTIARGRLALWVRRGDVPDIAALGDPPWQRIALANPLHAPYGRRAREALRHAGVFRAVQQRLVFGENVGQAAQMVASGAADVGIVAWSLAVSSDGVHALVDDALHAPLLHGAVLTLRGADDLRAVALLRFLQSDAARRLLAPHGFAAP